MATKEQFAGSLIGQCIGDALGFVVEGYPSGECRDYVDNVVRVGRVHERSRGPFPFGQYSDDSQLARELLQSYVERGRFDPEDYARRIAAIFTENRIVGRGRATEEAAFRLAAGVPWDEAGTPPPSAGNGSAMRAGPIGLEFHDDWAGLVEAAHDQGRITHTDPRCSAGAVAIAGSVALALQKPMPDVAEFVRKLVHLTTEFETPISDRLHDMTDWLEMAPEEAAGPISRAGEVEDFGQPWGGVSPYVVPSVLWSIYSFLRTPDNFTETVCAAIAVGGDVDTTAAMAGAISGARNGVGRLPGEWADAVNDQGTWKAAELRELAEKAFAVKAGNLA